jgi:hypothetical protein
MYLNRRERPTLGRHDINIIGITHPSIRCGSQSGPSLAFEVVIEPLLQRHVKPSGLEPTEIAAVCIHQLCFGTSVNGQAGWSGTSLGTISSTISFAPLSLSPRPADQLGSRQGVSKAHEMGGRDRRPTK